MSAADFTVLIYPAGETDSRELLLRAAMTVSGETEERLRVETAEGGKPYFPLLPELCFSVSHSGAFWACAFGKAPVGLDIQEHRACRAERLARRFFHPREVAYLTERDFAEADFYEVWAAKESYIKFTGQGLAMELDGFSVFDPPAAEIRRLSFLPDYSLYLCAASIGGASVRAM